MAPTLANNLHAVGAMLAASRAKRLRKHRADRFDKPVHNRAARDLRAVGAFANLVMRREAGQIHLGCAEHDALANPPGATSLFLADEDSGRVTRSGPARLGEVRASMARGAEGGGAGSGHGGEKVGCARRAICAKEGQRIACRARDPLGFLLLLLGFQIRAAKKVPEGVRKKICGMRDPHDTDCAGVFLRNMYNRIVVSEGLPQIALSNRIIPLDLAGRITSDYAREHRLVPFEEVDGVLRVAIDDPNSRAAAEIAGKFAGMSVETMLVPPADLEIALQRLYGRAEEGTLPTTTSASDDSFDDAVAVRVLGALLRRSVRDGASDIHIEPFDKALRVRLRIDGVLHEVPIEAVSARTLSARCKILANLDPAENRRPQDGRFREIVEGRVLDVRVSTVATAFGEKVVMRLLDRTRALLDLEALGMGPVALASFRKAIARPHGLILVTGPTGSGKTTTLYAALSERNDGRQNITTIEDPVEYELYGVNQIQVHHKIGVNFAAGLRHVLRQDPDIILVGEIRDAETADVAIQAALTGHLVLSTLHTNDAIGAVARLLDMGIEPFLVADALVAVLSQRLVRRLCPACRKLRRVTADEVARFAISSEAQVFDAGGCSACLGTGYRGRTGIYENLTLESQLAGLIRTRASSEAVLTKALAQGHRRLAADGIDRALAGVTTLDEVGRVS